MRRQSREREGESEPDRKQETIRESECPECASGDLVKTAGGSELACEECGVIVEADQIDNEPEWRAFNPPLQMSYPSKVQR